MDRPFWETVPDWEILTSWRDIREVDRAVWEEQEVFLCVGREGGNVVVAYCYEVDDSSEASGKRLDAKSRVLEIPVWAAKLSGNPDIFTVLMTHRERIAAFVEDAKAGRR